MQVNRNADILRHIIDYCIEIENTIERFGKDYKIFSSDQGIKMR